MNNSQRATDWPKKLQLRRYVTKLSLRELFGMVTFVALALGWYLDHQRQAKDLRRLESMIRFANNELDMLLRPQHGIPAYQLLSHELKEKKYAARIQNRARSP